MLRKRRRKTAGKNKVNGEKKTKKLKEREEAREGKVSKEE